MDPSAQLSIQELVRNGSSDTEATGQSRPLERASKSPTSNGFFSVFDNFVKSLSSSPKASVDSTQIVSFYFLSTSLSRICCTLEVSSRSKAPEEIVANLSGIHLDLGTFELVDDHNPKVSVRVIYIVLKRLI
jgi:hypothetical protein